MPLTLRLDAAPNDEPLLLADAKAHLRALDTSEDTLISSLIVAARERVEEICHRALMTQTLTLYLDDFPMNGWLRLPRAPLQNVVAVKYWDTAGVYQTLDPSQYWIDDVTEPARVLRAFGVVWPFTQLGRPNAVAIQFTAGYGDGAEDVPQTIRTAMLQIIAHWFENREAVITGTIALELPVSAERMLQTYRLGLV